MSTADLIQLNFYVKIKIIYWRTPIIIFCVVNFQIYINLTWLNIHVASCFKPERPPAPRKLCDLQKTNIKHLEDAQWSSKCLIFFAHRRPLGFATTFSQYLWSLIKHSTDKVTDLMQKGSLVFKWVWANLSLYHSTGISLVGDTKKYCLSCS